MKKKLQIAFISDAVFPYHKGGKETRLYELSTRLAAEGNDVHIYCMKWWKGSSNRIENGVQLHGICPFIPLYSGERRSIIQGLIFGLSCFSLLFQKLDVIDVDHMPFFPIYSTRVVCWLKRKRLIATWNEVWGKQYWDVYLGGIKGQIASLIEKCAVGLPDLILSISPLTTSRLVSQFNVPVDKIITIPCGYPKNEIDLVKPSSEKSDLIFVGRLLAHKNIDLLLQAVSILRDKYPHMVCRIVGTGPEYENILRLQHELKLKNNVVLHGSVHKHEEVFSLMKSSKIFVFPSTREGFGIVVLEANACGLPVVTVKHEDNASQQIAQVAVDFDALKLSEAIDKLLSNGVSKELRQNMRENVETYDWDKIIVAYKKAIS